MDKDLKEIHDFDAWALAGMKCGLKGPFRTVGFNNHHFVDGEGVTQAVWHGDKGMGTVPVKSDPIFKVQPVTKELEIEPDTHLILPPVTKQEKSDG